MGKELSAEARKKLAKVMAKSILRYEAKQRMEERA